MSDDQDLPHTHEMVLCAKRVRAQIGTEIIADTTRAMLLRCIGSTPVYYFPKSDVRLDLLELNGLRLTVPGLGEALHGSLLADNKRTENAVWCYQTAEPGFKEIEGYIAFQWDAVDHWMEEDEEIFVHPRDPYVRIDILSSHREVRVAIGSETVARTSRAQFLYETNLPVRYYIPKADVNCELLSASKKTSACPYKGTATYWSIKIGPDEWTDIIWSYAEPLPECIRIKDYLCFYNELVDAIYLDGEIVEKPAMRSNWQ